MHATTILTVFASSALAAKNLQPITFPGGVTNYIPKPSLQALAIPGPDQKPGDGPYKFDFMKYTSNSLNDFIKDKCNAVAECTGTGTLASEFSQPSHYVLS